MGYSENDSMVRFDFFVAESGKWKYTEAIDMAPFYRERFVHDAVMKAWEASGRHWYDDPEARKYWQVVVLEPYHENAYPILIQPGRAEYTPWPEYIAVAAPGEWAPGLHSGRAWAEHYGINIVDPDGWRHTGASLDEPISEELFWRRAMTSTTSMVKDEAQWRLRQVERLL